MRPFCSVGAFCCDVTSVVICIVCYLLGKVHRDLKLENILVSKEEEEVENVRVKVCEFHISVPRIWLRF